MTFETAPSTPWGWSEAYAEYLRENPAPKSFSEFYADYCLDVAAAAAAALAAIDAIMPSVKEMSSA